MNPRETERAYRQIIQTIVRIVELRASTQGYECGMRRTDELFQREESIRRKSANSSR